MVYQSTGRYCSRTGGHRCRTRILSTCTSAFREAGDHWGIRTVPDRSWHLSTASRENHLAAHAAYREALKSSLGLGHRRGIARGLEGSACLALAQGHAWRALRLAAAGSAFTPVNQRASASSGASQARRTLLPAWQSLNETRGQRVPGQKDSAMSLEKAIQYSLEEPGAVYCKLAGSIRRRTAETRSAGIPALRACSRTRVLIRRKVNAVNLVFGDVTVEPLNLRPQLFQRLQGTHRYSRIWASDSVPAPGISRSITNCGTILRV